MELMMTGRLMSFDEAKTIGLVNEVWDEAALAGKSFADAVQEYARQFTTPWPRS